ncbi:MAG: hypothetical protein JXA97_13340 [Anaerolineales bacterium]|nr:hypothetical protein [Anaerolineales bacterium]
MLFNTIVLGLILAGLILLIRVLRRGVSGERRDYEDDRRSKLDGIAESLAEK